VKTGGSRGTLFLRIKIIIVKSVPWLLKSIIKPLLALDKKK